MSGFDIDMDGLEELEDEIDELTSYTSPKSLSVELVKAVARTYKRKVVPMARERARPHVGGYAEKIDHESGGWSGDVYTHGLSSDSIVVDSHEWGTAAQNVNGNGTVDDVSNYTGQPGYRIPKNSDGPVAFDVGGITLTFDHVVHPGVEPKRFMRNTVEDSQELIRRNVAEAFEERLEDID